MDNSYFNLIASEPGSILSEKHEWLHNECGGTIQIGDDGNLRCEKCSTTQNIFFWIISDNSHLSEKESSGKKIDFNTAISFAGQVTSKAGRLWLINFLTSMGAENLSENCLYNIENGSNENVFNKEVQSQREEIEKQTGW
ncbi:hypothetical protein ACFL47_08305 [Candidatus Latescibacterota bacterium]